MKEKNRAKTRIYRECLINADIITAHADSSYTLTNEHDAVLDAMDKYGKLIKHKTQSRMFDFIEWLEGFADINYDKEKMETRWEIMVDDHVTDLMTVRQAYKFWKHSIYKNEYTKL